MRAHEELLGLLANDHDLLRQEDHGVDVEVLELEGIVKSLLDRPGPAWLDDVQRVELTDLQKGQLKAIGYAIED